MTHSSPHLHRRSDPAPPASRTGVASCQRTLDPLSVPQVTPCDTPPMLKSSLLLVPIAV